MEQRAKFTEALAYLLLYMINQGDAPVLVTVYRSSAEQGLRYRLGLSMHDGYNSVSPHTRGLAAHVLLPFRGVDPIDAPGEMYRKYHDFWVMLGGLSLDGERYAHFEFPDKGGDTK